MAQRLGSLQPISPGAWTLSRLSHTAPSCSPSCKNSTGSPLPQHHQVLLTTLPFLGKAKEPVMAAGAFRGPLDSST